MHSKIICLCFRYLMYCSLGIQLHLLFIVNLVNNNQSELQSDCLINERDYLFSVKMEITCKTVKEN